MYTAKSLVAALSAVKAAAAAAPPVAASVGYLTAMDRDDWAKQRGALENRSEAMNTCM
jgi:hypothetical protein